MHDSCELGLLGYLRFCKLHVCKSHSKVSLSTLLYCLFTAVFSLCIFSKFPLYPVSINEMPVPDGVLGRWFKF